jgi:hypothetical protein
MVRRTHDGSTVRSTQDRPRNPVARSRATTASRRRNVLSDFRALQGFRARVADCGAAWGADRTHTCHTTCSGVDVTWPVARLSR